MKKPVIKFFGHDASKKDFKERLFLAVLAGISANPKIDPSDAAIYAITAYKKVNMLLEKEEEEL